MLYNSESEMLYLRLFALGPYIDLVILGVSNMTLAGTPNEPYTFAPLEEEILPYQSRMRIVHSDYSLDDPRFFTEKDKEKRAWIIDPQRRTDLEQYVDSLHPKKKDLILQCDVDEIIRPSIMEWVIANPPRKYYRFECEYFTFSFRWKNPQYWGMPTIFRYGRCTHDMHYYRDVSSENLLQSYFSCLHCTSCFKSPVQLAKKFKGYGHTQFGQPPFIEPEYLYARQICHADPTHDLKFHLFDWEKTYGEEFNFPRNPKLRFLFEENPMESWEAPAEAMKNEKVRNYYNECITALPDGQYNDSYVGPLPEGLEVRKIT